MVSFFFETDLSMLEPAERRLLDAIDDGQVQTTASLAEEVDLGDSSALSHLQRLEQLGFVERRDGRYRLANSFFERWFSNLRNEARTTGNGTVRLPPSQLPCDTIADRYQIREKLGQGTNGDVYRAHVPAPGGRRRDQAPAPQGAAGRRVDRAPCVARSSWPGTSGIPTWCGSTISASRSASTSSP